MGLFARLFGRMNSPQEEMDLLLARAIDRGQRRTKAPPSTSARRLPSGRKRPIRMGSRVCLTMGEYAGQCGVVSFVDSNPNGDVSVNLSPSGASKKGRRNWITVTIGKEWVERAD
jgi:hypothetical protein